MKIRRFVAKDMKAALAQIKEELGADAVIMSNKKIAEGVEIMAAVDFNQVSSKGKSHSSNVKPNDASSKYKVSKSSNLRDVDNDVVILGQSSKTITQQINNSQYPPADSLAALLNRQIQHEDTTQNNDTVSHNQSTDSSAVNIEQQFKKFTDRLQHSAINNSPYEPPREVASKRKRAITENNSRPNIENQANDENINHDNQPSILNKVSSSEFENMQKEMNSIRQLLEHQMSGLMWQDMAQKNPQKAMLISRLMSLGLTDQIADQIAGYIPPQQNEQDAWEQAKNLIVQQLNTTNNDIIHSGGVVALVGPTGVGKTTTIAKLAARFAQIHGADQVALISTDSFRIAGFEQLSTYGRIIGCQVKLATDNQVLEQLLQQYSKKKLILIDTAGMGQRDIRLAEHLTTLFSNARVRIRNYLVLSANTQQRVMQENVERFKKIPLAGCIYTKLDESLSVGEIISTSIQNGLSIGYLTDGQRVPEDIKVANAEKLVTLADKMAIKTNNIKQVSWQPMPVTSSGIA